ncbi:MAG: hypothetical protein HN474_07740, partial [Nitrospina sp.]|nr:hypothetical protein [Nitrospina sp.]
MKIICTHCQAGYDVDLPEIKPEGLEFKCAKCEQKFLVKPQDIQQAKASVSTKETVAAIPPSGKELDSIAENEEEFPSEKEEEALAGENVDNLLDDLLKEDLNSDKEETTLETEEDQKTGIDATKSTEGVDDLDGLLDDLITDDIVADDEKDNLGDALPAVNSTEGADDLDGLLDDLITDDIVADDEKEDEGAVEAADAEPAKTDAEDDDLDDILNDLDDDEKEEDDAEAVDAEPAKADAKADDIDDL